MIDKDSKDENQKTGDEVPASTEGGDVYFFNPWDEQFARELKGDRDGFDF